MAQFRFWQNNKLMLALVLGSFGLSLFAWFSRSAEWRTALASWIQPAPEAPPADPHAGHDHGHDHGDHGDQPHLESIEISESGLKNIGYEEFVIKADTFEKKLTLPATVIERPGYSQIQIPAPLTGIVTKIHQIQGAAITPGSALFEMRLTHEELVAAQRDFLRSAENIDVVTSEIKRLEAVGEGIIAGKRILELQYEKQKLEANFRAEHQALLLHDLTEAQIQQIVKSRELLNSLTVFAPPAAAGNTTTYHLQELPVKIGQQIEAGQPLAVLANHSSLYLEGRAFENDVPNLRKALAAGWKVTARPNGTSDEKELIKDLELLYLADHIDAETRAFTFYLALPNSVVSEREANSSNFIQWKYRPGQRMELLIPIEQWKDKIILPVAAVVTEGAENYVFIPNGKAFVRTPVHVEYRDLQYVVVENNGDLFDGTIIAGQGAYQMQLAIRNKAGGAIDPHAGHNH